MIRFSIFPFFMLLLAACDGTTGGPDVDSGPSPPANLDSGEPLQNEDGGRQDAGDVDTDAGDNTRDASDGNPDAGDVDAGGPIALDDGGLSNDAGVPGVDSGPIPVPDFPANWPRNRGWDWIRSNTPMVSALTVRMGAPTPQAVTQYYDAFGANTVHTWEAGLPAAIAAWTAPRPGGRWISWVDRSGNSAANGLLLGGAAPPAGRIGYQVGDEPRTRPDFDEILAGFARVQQADPEGLRIFNFTDAADEIDAFLVDTCNSGLVDVIAYDRYTLNNSTYESLARFRDAAQACGLPYWRYIKSYFKANEDLQSESDLRWDAFVGVLYGYTGHSWFVYNIAGWEPEHIPSTFFAVPDDWASATTPRFAIAAQINRELEVYGRAQTRLQSTGIGYVAEQSLGVLHPPPGAPAWTPGTGGDRFITGVETVGGANRQDVVLGFFEDRYEDTYVIVQNPNRSGGTFPNQSSASTTVRLNLDFAGASGVRTDQVLVLRPTGVVEPVAIVGGALELPIAAGDIVFFKYDTGRPFEGY